VSFYAKADLAYNTSGKTLDESFAGLLSALKVNGVPY
jgi:hypothetical protein